MDVQNAGKRLPTEVDQHDARHVGARNVNNLRAIQSGNRARFVQNLADMLQHRLGCHGQRHRGNVGMPERQHPRPKMKMPVVI
jgi:hypothetical protein